MKISVVVIVYNLENFIEETLASVFKQTRKADEVIVVDDCSTDNSFAILGQSNFNFKLVKNDTNSGALVTALNGIKLATGDIVSMLDGDDVWAENKLETVEKEFLEHPDLVLLSHQHIRMRENGELTTIRDETHRNIEHILAGAQQIKMKSDLFRDSILAQKGFWLGSAYSFRKACFGINLFEKQLAEFPQEKIKDGYLDLVIAPFLVLTNKNGQVGYTDKTHFLYRLRSNASLSSNASVEQALRSIRKGRNINELILHIMRSNGCDKKYIDRKKSFLLEYSFMENLYKRKPADSIRQYFYLSRKLWPIDKIWKEFIRMTAVWLVGPERFLRYKQKKAFPNPTS